VRASDGDRGRGLTATGSTLDTRHSTLEQMPDTDKTAADNRSRQLNPQDPAYHSSRGHTAPAQAAAKAAQANQEKRAAANK
jgi:hypothetical protein